MTTHRRRAAVLVFAAALPAVPLVGCSGPLSRADAPEARTAWSPPEGSPGLPSAKTPSPESADSEAKIAEDMRRGHLEAEAGRLDQAARYYERVLRADPRHAVAHHRTAVIADQTGDFAAAERHYLAALRERPDDADVLNDLGYSYVLQNRYPDGERVLRDALAVAPRHERALTNLGLLYGKAGDYDRALAVLMLTGPESEARAKLASLVPESRRELGTDAARGVTRPPSDARLASYETAVPDPVGSAPNEATRALAEEMARARAAARPAPPHAGMRPGLIGPRETMTGSVQADLSPADRFLGYDRPDAQASAPPYGSTQAPGPGYIDVSYGPAVTADTQAASRSLRDPLDAMPLWGAAASAPALPEPPAYSRGSQPIRTASASFPSDRPTYPSDRPTYPPALPTSADDLRRAAYGPAAGPAGAPGRGLPPAAFGAESPGTYLGRDYVPPSGFPADARALGGQAAAPPVAPGDGRAPGDDVARAYEDEIARYDAEIARLRAELRSRQVPPSDVRPAPSRYAPYPPAAPQPGRY